MTTQNSESHPIDYQSLIRDIRHELQKCYHLNMHPALVLDTIDILIHEQTDLACVADEIERSQSENVIKELHIALPPAEHWRVVYTIDVDAPDALAAAKVAHVMMVDIDSLWPILQVMDGKGEVTTINLANESSEQ
jgi:hypothetical protein